MAKSLENRIKYLEVRANVSGGTRIKRVLIMCNSDITDDEKRHSLDKYYEKYPEDRNPIRIIKLVLRRDRQSGEVMIERMGRLKKDDDQVD
ncbi:hypothetical protein ACFLTQ_00150 [Chloroflexota bacterium]